MARYRERTSFHHRKATRTAHPILYLYDTFRRKAFPAHILKLHEHTQKLGLVMPGQTHHSNNQGHLPYN